MPKKAKPILFCPRCEASVRAIVPWRGFKPLWTVWKLVFVLWLLCFPIIAADYCVSLPSSMLYMVGGGLLRGFAREKPVCTRCSLELDPKVLAPASIQPRPPA